MDISERRIPQDVLRLGNLARMNTPGTTAENWRWRADPRELTEALVGQLAELTTIYQRTKKDVSGNAITKIPT